MDNLHRYDSQLAEVPRAFLPEINAADILERLLSSTRNKISPLAHRFLSQIISERNQKENHEPFSDLRAEEILCLLASASDNPDLLLILEEQLSDMATGFCPSGRVTRLWQIVLAFDLQKK